MTLSVLEVRRLLAALHGAEDQQRRRLSWSRFRRHHQAGAQRCHEQRRARQAPAIAVEVPTPLVLCGLRALTDEFWEQIRWLLPPQKPQMGRPAIDHRRILDGILWVVRTGSSWRELPERFGPWATVASRYQRWSKAGVWQRIVDVLHPPAVLPGASAP